MKTKQIIGLVLLVAGVAGLYFGYEASTSPLEKASEALTGRFTDETTWHFIIGGACAVAGFALVLFGRR